MTDLLKPSAAEATPSSPDSSAQARSRRPYEPPQCEKKRSIHRVTLISGMGVMSMGQLAVSGT